ncbi:hypothetical protein AGMMS49545_17340 [Betaproteobacteria bacterium]|nr:hypothetical protein AGMMS49545_17340 [Betaproteobacteria bacterium]GHU46195.1 hypothetical protein AGMMS50289_19010 [Betaproteobacteria bacterium]
MFPDDERSRHNYINVVFSAKRYDLAEQALDKIVSDGHGFEIDEQIIYANILTIKDNPESLDYFEGIINHIPEFHIHEKPDSQENLKRLIVRKKAASIATAYNGYSTAVFIFRAAPEQALALNNTALWYAKPMGSSFVSDLEYRNVAYLYAMGEFEKGDVLRRKIESDMGVELTREVTESLLAAYCRNTAVAEHCKELRKRGLLASASSMPLSY